MRILHIDTEKGFRGGEQQLLWLVEGLKEKGIETAVATIKDELCKRCAAKGIKTYILSGNQLIDWVKIAKLSKNFDIIHAHSAKAHNIAALSKVFSKKPLVYTRRNDYKPKKDLFTKFKYKKADKIICISKTVENILKKTLNVDERKFLIIYSTTNPEIEKLLDYKKTYRIKKEFKGKFIIGTAAALTEQKNIPNFIEAASIAIKTLSDAVFVVAGEGYLKEKLQRMIKEKGLESLFFLIGFKKDIQNYIKAFDLFVLPSDNEGLGSAILNAMLLKVPVISTDAGGTVEVIKNLQNGVLVKKNSPEELAEAIIMLHKNGDLREKLIKNAYKTVKENFSVEKMVNQYITIYNETLSK